MTIQKKIEDLQIILSHKNAREEDDEEEESEEFIKEQNKLIQKQM